MHSHDILIRTPHLAATDLGLTRCTGHPVRPAAALSPAAREWLDLACRELDYYFAGSLREFTVPVDLGRVSGEHRCVPDALSGVVHGETITYAPRPRPQL